MCYLDKIPKKKIADDLKVHRNTISKKYLIVCRNRRNKNGYKLDWTDEEILQYALGKLDVSEYEIDGMKNFLENNPVAKQNMKTI